MKKILLFAAFGLSMSVAAQKTSTVTVHETEGKNVIPKEIYGQFAEHLGTCIYGGLWVGPESSIPNTNGYRNDVLNALKELKELNHVRLVCIRILPYLGVQIQY